MLSNSNEKASHHFSPYGKHKREEKNQFQSPQVGTVKAEGHSRLAGALLQFWGLDVGSRRDRTRHEFGTSSVPPHCLGILLGDRSQLSNNAGSAYVDFSCWLGFFKK